MDEPKKHPRWAKCLTLLDFDFAIWDIRAVIPTESGLQIWTTLFVSKAHVQVSARLQCPRRSFYQVPPGVIKRSNRKPPHILCRFIAGKFGGVSIDTFDHWRVCSFYNMHHEQCQCFHSEGSGMNTWPSAVRGPISKLKQPTGSAWGQKIVVPPAMAMEAIPQFSDRHGFCRCFFLSKSLIPANVSTTHKAEEEAMGLTITPTITTSTHTTYPYAPCMEYLTTFGQFWG